MIREVMDVPDVLDDPRAGAAEFNALLPTDVCEDLRDILRMSTWRSQPAGKPAAVTSVPVSMGNAVEVQAKLAARARSQPCSIFTTIISMAMIASSTSNPSAMMRAPSVMRWRSRPVAYITSSTIASTSGTDSAATMPVRQPSDRKLTTSTMTSASANVSTNSETDSLTMWG
jgi:hypothetical protein